MFVGVCTCTRDFDKSIKIVYTLQQHKKKLIFQILGYIFILNSHSSLSDEKLFFILFLLFEIFLFRSLAFLSLLIRFPPRNNIHTTSTFDRFKFATNRPTKASTQKCEKITKNSSRLADVWAALLRCFDQNVSWCACLRISDSVWVSSTYNENKLCETRKFYSGNQMQPSKNIFSLLLLVLYGEVEVEGFSIIIFRDTFFLIEFLLKCCISRAIWEITRKNGNFMLQNFPYVRNTSTFNFRTPQKSHRITPSSIGKLSIVQKKSERISCFKWKVIEKFKPRSTQRIMLLT